VVFKEGKSRMAEFGQVLPRDPHNEALVANVHPPAWANPEPAPCYNLVVLGAGSAGLVTALGAAGLGAKVAIVERHLLGGDCLNVGCVPSKCLIRSSRAAADAREASAFGATSGVPAVDFAAVMERMRRLRSDTIPPSGSGDLAWTSSSAKAASPLTIPLKWTAARCGSERRSSPPARAPCIRRCPDWSRLDSSPTRPSFRSPNVRRG
jgi:hypothetical protein